MNSVTTEHDWNMYKEQELALLIPVLDAHGYTLDSTQPHTTGERFLMQAVTTTSGRKLILLGTSMDGKRVIIKATRDEAGIRELAHEELCRNVLGTIDFAKDTFQTPKRIERIREGGFVIIITEFITQEKTFLERPLEEQFDIALDAFKGQEGAHATTFKHRTLIRDTFGIRDGATYLTNFDSFQKNCALALPQNHELHTLLNTAKQELLNHEETLEQYCGFLTHTDFVPHNIRIHNGTLFLLDHSSLTFGNKYEGWARFLNFMTLYNPPLEHALVGYVKNNRTPEESQSLRLMRIYRLGEIIWYYVNTLTRSTGNLLTLNTERIHFWSTVLTHILKDEAVPADEIQNYKTRRDTLRSADEKERQRGLH